MHVWAAHGRAPHFTELAAELGLDLPAARDLVHELVGVTPGWVHPGTDHIASFPPFNLQPTQYRVTIDGEQRWFAQCGFERGTLSSPDEPATAAPTWERSRTLPRSILE